MLHLMKKRAIVEVKVSQLSFLAIFPVFMNFVITPASDFPL
jgi:hypothetical protein